MRPCRVAAGQRETGADAADEAVAAAADGKVFRFGAEKMRRGERKNDALIELTRRLRSDWRRLFPAAM